MATATTITKPRSRVFWWVAGILLVFVLVVGGLLYVAWSTVTGWLGGTRPGDPVASTQSDFTPHVRNGQVEFDVLYGREATGLVKFTVSDPDTGKPLWVLVGPGQHKVPKFVYGQVPTDPVYNWTQELPADGAPPPDVRGKRVKVQVLTRFQVMFGPGQEINERVIEVPADKR